MSNQHAPLDRFELEARALAMFPAVLEKIDRLHRRRTRIRWTAVVGSAVVLVLSGALLGAAIVSPPVFNPGGGELYNSHGTLQPATFAIDCETSTDVRTASGYSQQYDNQSDVNAAIANFAVTCDGIVQRAENEDVVGQAVQAQGAKGIHCGIINVVGAHTVYWSLSGNSPGAGATFTDSPDAYSAGCDSVITITVPRVSVGSVAVCAEASNWALVIERHNQSVTSVCAAAGYPVWGQ